MADDREAGGVQSAQVALALLSILAERGGSLPLSQLAAAADMPPAKAHRYVVSLIRAGFVEQAGRQGAYCLGRNALRVGLTALGRLDVMDHGVTTLYDLRDEVDQTTMLAIWSDGGPTVVRWVESSHPITVNVRTGSKMPLVRSATGRVFGAYMPWSVVEPVLTAEMVAAGISAESSTFADRIDEAKAIFARVREDGVSVVAGEMLAGVQALGSPIFNLHGQLEAVMTILGTVGSFDGSASGVVAKALAGAAQLLSERIGFNPSEPRA